MSRRFPRIRKLRVELLFGSILLVLTLAFTCGIAGASSSRQLGGKISAHLTRTSFTSSQAGSVKLLYSFSAPSKSFAYLLSLKKGAQWQTVASVKKSGSFKGSKSMTVKRIFAGKPVKIGSYRLKLSADGGGVTLSFRVVKGVSGAGLALKPPASPPASPPVTPPSGHAPTNTALPVVSGTTAQGQTLTTSDGNWDQASSFSRQWRRCDNSGNSCVDISGATSSSYVLQVADVSHTIRIVITATNAYGSASATSSQTAVVAAPVSAVSAISAGGAHTCALLSDSRIKCWGFNQFGQLGNGTTITSSVPVLAAGTAHVNLSAGWNFTCSVVSDGKVFCWGSNEYGQLGDGTTTAPWIPDPVQVSGITNAVRVSATSTDHACALLSDSTVKCWGKNDYGQLGNGTTTSSSTPVPVSGITNATAIATGGKHSCALLSDGTIQCWGLNSSGQLGDGDWANSPTSVPVNGITNATSVSAGAVFTCARLSDGKVDCWGDDYYGQLGNGTTTAHMFPPYGYASPVQVVGIDNAVQVSATSTDHACALLSNGTVKCWGANNYGQLGDGTTNDSSTPVQVNGVASATTISAGLTHNCVLLSGGSAECWGENASGQLGNGLNSIRMTPVAVSGITTAAQTPRSVDGGDSHTCALLSNKRITCWGKNDHGQLGNGTTTDSPTPVPVSGIADAVQVTTGSEHSCARLSDGTVKCWGYNDDGELAGDTGTNNYSSTPIDTGITSADQISAYGYDTCAVLSNKKVKCWGYSYGFTPIEVGGITDAIQVSTGGVRTCAVLSTQTVDCWTNNSGSTASEISGITGAIQVSAGYNHACAVLDSGTIDCWGDNSAGELGGGTTDPSSSPVQVSGITTAAEVDASVFFSCARLTDHSVVCWGYNSTGELGNDTTNSSSSPVEVTGITNAEAIGIGKSHACGVLLDGSIRCWGYDFDGQLGNGEMGYSPTPVGVIGLTA